MRFNCGPSLRSRILAWCDARDNYLGNWHRWFAWRPVRVAPGECRWLEFVHRRQTYGGRCTYAALPA